MAAGVIILLVGLMATQAVVLASISVNDSSTFASALASSSPIGITRILLAQDFVMEVPFAFQLVGNRSIILSSLDAAKPVTVRVVPQKNFLSPFATIGNVVYGAGDLNGDGYFDFISASSTRWTIGLGNASFSVPSSSATLPRRSWQVGDVDGDGFDDFAYLADNAGRAQSQVHIVFGGQADLSFFTGNLLRAVFSVPSEYQVQSVARLGDVNGDGFQDIAFTYTSVVRAASKSIFVALGSKSLKKASQTPLFVADPTILDCAAQTIVPLLSTQQSRLSIAAAGDLDGDGYGDFLIGVPPLVFLAYGSNQFDQRTLRFDQSILSVISSNDINARDFGVALAADGDFNGDSFADFVIATPSKSEVAIVLGGSFINTEFAFSSRLRTSIDKLPNIVIQGRSILGCGQGLAVQDFDLDGKADIVIYCATTVSSQPRRLFIVYGGGTTQQPNSTLNLLDWSQEIVLGSRIDAFDANVGDIDNDGYPDILVSNLTRTFAAVSPGKSRALLDRKQGIFVIKDSSSLTIDGVAFLGSRKISTIEGSGTLTYTANSTCPASVKSSSSCPACNGSLNGILPHCPLPCDNSMPSSLGYTMQARFETNLETFRLVASQDSVVTLRFDDASRSLLAFVHFPQNFETLSSCGLSRNDGLSFVVTSDVHSFVIETASETMPYSGRAAYFFEIILLDDARSRVAFLYLDSLGRVMQSTLDLKSPGSAIQDLGPVLTLPFLPFGSFAGVLKTCASMKSTWVCFLSVQVFNQLYQVVFSPTTQIEVGIDSPYPSSQLELYTLLPGNGNLPTVKGAAIMDSTFISPELFTLVYAQRDDSDDVVRRCSLMLSAFSAADLTPIVEQFTVETFESDLILKTRATGSTVAVQLWQAAQIIIYTLTLGDDGAPSARRLNGVVISTVLFPSSFDMAQIPDGDGSHLILSVTDVSNIRSFILDLSGNGQATLLQTAASAILPPMSGVRSSWIVPRFSLLFNAHIATDSLAEIKQNRTLDFGTDVVDHLNAYPFSGFPMLSRLALFRLTVPNTSRQNFTCPRGFYCTSDTVSACPKGSYQIGDDKTSLGDCETNSCAEGFYCGAGAAFGSTYRRVLAKSSSSLDLQMLDSSQRTVNFTFTNSDGQQSIQLRLKSIAPAWLASIRVLETQTRLDRIGLAARINPSSDLSLQVTLDATQEPQSSFNTTLIFEWWYTERRSERSLISLPVSVTIVPVLVVPRIVSTSLAANETFVGEIVLFNVFPTTEIRATVALGCLDGDQPAAWLSANLPPSEVVLQPGLGQRLSVPLTLTSNGLNGNPLDPAELRETCVRFKMIVDGISVEEVAQVQLIATTKCPSDYFSPTGANSGSIGCFPCASDSFQPVAGSVSCIPAPKCPKGTFSTRNGLRFNDSSCLPCPLGSYQPLEASSTCLPCPRGQYGNRQGLDACFNCPDQLTGGSHTGAKDVTECEASPGFYKLQVFSNKTIATQCQEGTNCSSPSTLQTLALFPGFWRASLNSSTIFPCRKFHYCQGYVPPTSEGLTPRRVLDNEITASDYYCRPGHEGVMCEACNPGYAKRGPDRVCSPCNETTILQDQSSVAGIVIILLLVPSLCLTAILIYKRSTRKGGLSVRASSRLWECMKLVDGGTKPKLIIGLFQVVAACIANFSSSFPSAFANVARSFSIFYVDAINIIDLGCALEIARQGFYKALLITTIAPIISVIIVFLINRFSVRFLVDTEEKRRQINVISIAVSLFTLFLVYPGVSNTIIKTFICETFDDGRTALQADYSVACDDVWRSYVVYAAFMVVLYVAGIPLGFAGVLIRNRKSLNPNGSGPFLNKDAFRSSQLRSQIAKTKPLFFLVQAYLPFYYWFEPLDLIVRLAQTSVVLAFEDAWAGILFMVCITVAYLLILVQLAPYIKYTNHILAIVCQIAILTIGMTALVNNLAQRRVNEDVTNVICFVALFAPLVFALPLHVVQIRISRFDVFFDAHEADGGDDEVIDLDESIGSKYEEMLLGKGQYPIIDSTQVLSSNKGDSKMAPSSTTALRAPQVQPTFSSESQDIPMSMADSALSERPDQSPSTPNSMTGASEPAAVLSASTEHKDSLNDSKDATSPESSSIVTKNVSSASEKRKQSQTALQDDQ